MRSVCPRLAPNVVLVATNCAGLHVSVCIFWKGSLGGINCRWSFLIFLHTCPASYQWFVWVCFYLGTHGLCNRNISGLPPQRSYTLPVSVTHHNPPGCVQLLDEERRQRNRESEDKAPDFLQLLTWCCCWQKQGEALRVVEGRKREEEGEKGAGLWEDVGAKRSVGRIIVRQSSVCILFSWTVYRNAIAFKNVSNHSIILFFIYDCFKGPILRRNHFAACQWTLQTWEKCILY